MTDDEKRERTELAEAEKRKRYVEAVEVFLKKKAELGRMPLERDFKKDPTVNLGQLISDLEVKSFSEAVIKVNREIRVREGRPERIKFLERESQAAVKMKREKLKERAIADRELERAMRDEELKVVAKMVQENLAEKEETNMSDEKIGKQRGEVYTYAEVWQYAKEHDLANMTNREIAERRKEIGGGPVMQTLSRLLGKKTFWEQELAAETPEEGEEILRQLKADEGEVVDYEVEEAEEVAASQELKILALEDLTTMLKGGGMIDVLAQTCESFKAAWNVVVYVGETPVEITIRAEK